MSRFMGRRCAALTVLVAFLMSCARTEWTDYTSEPNRFVASFPGKPTETSKTANTAIGAIEIKMYGVSDRQTSFSVAVADYPAQHVTQMGSTAILDMARDGAVLNIQGVLLSEQIIDVGGNPGRELKISAAGGEGTIRAKVFLVGNRIYQVVAVTPVEESYAPQVQRFLDSFRLL